MKTTIKTLATLFQNIEQKTESPAGWEINAIQSENCLSYVAWNTKTKEALIIDPKVEDKSSYEKIIQSLATYHWVAIIDTHTHADHVSLGAKLSESLKAPLIMHHASPSQKPQIKIFHHTTLHSQAGELCFWLTPGHTTDSVTVTWGPFLFTGDLILFNDTGRDDLPGGNANIHFDSLELMKREAAADLIMLPGHDHQGRASLWKEQLLTNTSLTQSRNDFVREAEAFDAPAPVLFKHSLKENFK